MQETLNFLKEYANTSDNLYLLAKLELLEEEIEFEILKGKLETLNQIKI